MKRKLFAGAAAVAAVAGVGAVVATAATPREETDAVLGDIAEELGVQQDELESAIEKALAARIDAAVASGDLTSEQAAELEERLSAGDFPLFALPGRHVHGHVFGGLDAAARYLDMTEEELRDAVDEDTSLADVAEDRGKSVDGLVDTLVTEASGRLDEAVASGRLSDAERDERVAELRELVTAFVNGERPAPRRAPAFHVLPPAA